MTSTMTLADGGQSGTAPLNIGIFLVFVCITLYIVYRTTGKNRTKSDYYAAGGVLSGRRNGIALSGDFLSAASFLGITGAIAIHGYDGFLYSVGWVVAWLVALLLIAEPLRNLGRYTIGDVIGYKSNQRSVRAASSISTLVISFFYMLAQMSGAGELVSLLLGIHNRVGQALVVVAVGAVMLLYVLVGGMKGTTWVQVIKATLLLICVTLITVFLFGSFGFSISNILNAAADNNPLGQHLLTPGGWYGQSATSELDFVSLAISLVLGISCLPHILMRFYTVPDAKEARRSVAWCTGAMFIFYLSILIVGFGAAALVGPRAILSAPGQENSAAPLLALRIGGPVLFGIVSGIAFATILAVVAGLTIASSSSFAHDVYANVIKRGRSTAAAEIRVARTTSIVVGAFAIVAGILASGQNVAFLVSLALALAASANLAPLLYSLYWRRFNTAGSLGSVYGGLVCCLTLIVFSPVFSGTPSSLFPDVDFHWFPLTNPGIVSIPFSFLCGFVATLVSRERVSPEKQAEMEVRALLGAGAVRE